ncbi:CRISPR-associated helicase/endonuclease Cas3 [Granulibacter bethesdensis]|uniref:CRISPR-associated helicase/endonuclease Cas3 n=1 Tax=Granulibacter bethesdensis TaxID=364410 RepID=UPI00090B1242|nr:CRISPR-associated helicase/endonuclease Cas3 [Granulibacter bethesdensis]APH59724.1 Superfamily II DNA and RNA helicase [Granulibacter bethesdensis]
MQWKNWPGKSSATPDGPEHPAAFHMLDVAAVAERLIEPFGMAPALRDALVVLAGLHDIGKISESFRAMLREGVAQPGFRHWELSEALFYVEDARIAARLGGTPLVRKMLYAAIAGHHGRPSEHMLGALPPEARLSRELFRALKCVGEGREPAARLMDAFFDLWPEASLEGLTLAEATTLSWWLAGFCAAADWVGSNSEWFPPKTEADSLAAYLQQTRAIAARAVVEAGIAGTMVREGKLFDFALRPMQVACSTIPLPDGPTLAIVEDGTGTGKTEAALILAHRFCLAGKGRGLFDALPTMATTDAMFDRASRIVGRMFDNPSVTLAHGRAGLSVPFRDLVQRSRTGGPGEITSSDWLAEGNRRALLADVGIGTIDQALLSVLPVRFQTLRIYGLSSKILLVDEVHEMGEPYIAEELTALLKMHRAAGGSAILLTATLPMSLRSKLLATYDGASDNPAYPALTIAGGEAITQFPAEDYPVKGPVKVERLDTAADAVTLLAGMAMQGAACVWVRNAVDDAIEAVEALRAAGVEARLIHARFALCDRKRIEAEILARVGKNGQGRAGFVLVGTQVLESSLDLDFDVMVSDIAPIAALIQRAGRLWRHMDIRPVSVRPVAGPVLYVLSPDPSLVEDERWLHGTLGKGAWVYALADVWRSARVLFTQGQIGTPDRQRALIEAVYGADAEPVPEALLKAEQDKYGKDSADRGLAWHNIVKFTDGYRKAGRGDDDVNYPTRLGEEVRVLRLARRTGLGLIPWAEGEGEDAWALSEVSAHRKKLDALPLPDQSSPEIMKIAKDWPEWKRAQIRLCPVDEDGTICDGLHYDEECGLVFVSV